MNIGSLQSWQSTKPERSWVFDDITLNFKSFCTYRQSILTDREFIEIVIWYVTKSYVLQVLSKVYFLILELKAEFYS